MQKKIREPFSGAPGLHHNACMSNYAQFWEIGSHYMRAADALVKNAVEDHSVLDVYVSPLIFLYRKQLSFFLKTCSGKVIIWPVERRVITDKCFQTHDLLKLWQQLKGNCQKVLGADFPLIPMMLNYWKSLLLKYKITTQGLMPSDFRSIGKGAFARLPQSYKYPFLI